MAVFFKTFSTTARGLTGSDNATSEFTALPTVKKIEKETKGYSFDAMGRCSFSMAK